MVELEAAGMEVEALLHQEPEEPLLMPIQDPNQIFRPPVMEATGGTTTPGPEIMFINDFEGNLVTEPPLAPLGDYYAVSLSNDESTARSTLLQSAFQDVGGIRVQHLSPISKQNIINSYLSYPPIQQSHHTSETQSSGSPTSTSNLSSPPIQINGLHQAPLLTHYLLPMYSVQYGEYEIIIPVMISPPPAHDGDMHIPTNVEELIMPQIDNDNSSMSTSPQKKSVIMDNSSDRELSSSLSTEWTHTNVTGAKDNGGIKQRRKKQGSKGSNLPYSSTCNGGLPVGRSKKERPRTHRCSICNKGFKDNYTVEVHLRTHTGEKPFPCTLCGKTFRQNAHLTKHNKTHAPKPKTNGQTQA